MVTKIISNIRIGSAFVDIIDPEIKMPKAQNKRQKKTLLKINLTQPKNQIGKKSTTSKICGKDDLWN